MTADYTIERDDEGISLVVTGDWSEKMARAVRRDGVDGLKLNYMRGFRERNLNFLEGLPVRRLDIVARTLDDLEPIHGLSGTLRSLSLISGSSSRLDLARLPELTSLSAEWMQVGDTIGAATNLSSLYVGAYGEPDFSPLAPLHRLKVLRMKDRPYVESLRELSAFPELRWLEVAGAQRLADFDGLRGEASKLEHLSLSSCKRLAELEVLTRHTALTYLDISDCGVIASLRPIRGLTNLSTVLLHESTRVEDNDLSPLLSLPRLSLMSAQSRRDYRPSVAEVQAAVSARQAATEPSR